MHKLASGASAKAKKLLFKATFIKNIEQLYTEYVYVYKYYEQRQRVYTIAQKISAMAYQQYTYTASSPYRAQHSPKVWKMPKRLRNLSSKVIPTKYTLSSRW